MSLLTRQLSTLVARSSRILTVQHKSIQTSGTASGGGGHYSELTDYNLHLWDRPEGFPDGNRPHKEHFWERRCYSSEIEDYWMAIWLGMGVACGYAMLHTTIENENSDEIIKIAEERVANGILIDLFPDQKEAKLYVNNREFFPDHDPHSYDPTEERDYFWIQ